MDQTKTGSLIRSLRKQQGLTQLALAQQLGVSDKAVSKWERGLGCPDLSLLPALSQVFQVNMESLLNGQLPVNRNLAGNLNRLRFYCCPNCGNWPPSACQAEIICCGHRLTPLTSRPMDAAHTPQIQTPADETYLTFSHEMTKAHFIRFVVWVGFDRALMVQLYPEQEAAARLPHLHGHGTLYVLCTQHGLMKAKL